MKKIHKLVNILPGMAGCFIIAVISISIHRFLPLLGAAVIAMFLGMMVRLIFSVPSTWQKGIRFTSKQLLKLSLIFLGGTLSLNQLLEAGSSSLVLMFFTLSSAFFSAWICGKYLLGIPFCQRNLIAVGTGICGGSAIAALSPVLEAEDQDVAFAISATFLFDVAAVLVFPLAGVLLGLSEKGYALWVGTAVNDTSSVVAAGYAFSEGAGKFASMVKMTRTTMLIPIGFLLNTVMNIRARRQSVSQKKKLEIGQLIPWFVIFFALVVILNTVFPFPSVLSAGMKNFSSLVITMALGGIGLNTDLKYLLKTGRSPLLLGGIVSLVVVFVSLAVQVGMGAL